MNRKEKIVILMITAVTLLMGIGYFVLPEENWQNWSGLSAIAFPAIVKAYQFWRKHPNKFIVVIESAKDVVITVPRRASYIDIKVKKASGKVIIGGEGEDIIALPDIE